MIAVVVVPGAERKLGANMAIRDAQSELVRFNALVAAEEDQSQAGTPA